MILSILCSEARVDMSRVRNGQLSDRDFQRLADTAGKMSEAKIFIDDNADLTVMELRSRARRLMAEHNLGLLIVDYLQLMSGSSRTGSENRQQEISAISRNLKGMAKDLSIPVLALSQLSRAVETRGGDHQPRLSDLRESGSIEQDADVVVFIFREEMYKPDDESLRNLATIIIGKQRNGPTGQFDLHFHKAYTRFTDLQR